MFICGTFRDHVHGDEKPYYFFQPNLTETRLDLKLKHQWDASICERSPRLCHRLVYRLLHCELDLSSRSETVICIQMCCDLNFKMLNLW